MFGSIPSEMGLLADLETISFYINSVTGSIPEDLYQLEKLREFDLDRNQLTGTLSSNVAFWTDLTFLGSSGFNPNEYFSVPFKSRSAMAGS